MSLKCSECSASFTLRKNLMRHVKSHEEVWNCDKCEKTFNREDNFKRHLLSAEHDQAPRVLLSPKRKKTDDGHGGLLRLIKQGVGDVLKVYRSNFQRTYNDLVAVSTLLVASILAVLKSMVEEENGIKAQLRCTAKFFKATDPNTTIEAHFNSKQGIHLRTSNFKEQYDTALGYIRKQIDEFTHRGSGWVMERIVHVDLYVSKYQPIRGNTYSKLPKSLKDRKAIVNIKNRDEKCFMWSVLAALHPASHHVQRVSKYKGFEDELNFNNISFPVSLEDVSKFERQNNLAINVLGYGGGLYPLRPTQRRDIPAEHHINLLLLTPDDDPPHYCLIKNMDRLLFSQTKHEHRKFICNYCLCPFNTCKRLEKHQEFCSTENQRVEIPEDNVLNFRNVHKQLRSPYVMYADFECFTQKTGDDKVPQKHVPNSYGIAGVSDCGCGHSSFDPVDLYRGADPVTHFLNNVIAKGEEFIGRKQVSLCMTSSDEVKFRDATMCHICSETLGEGTVRDHCHHCGRFRGAAHSKCNLDYRKTPNVTVFFHNLRKYDGHLIMQELGLLAKKRKIAIDCVPKGMEDYLTFSFNLKTNQQMWKLRFVDSLAFLNASLDTLASAMPNEDFRAVHSSFEEPDLLLRKGIYPYDYMDDVGRFQETQLPPADAFYNKLKLESVSASDYAHARNVWKTFNCQTMGDYHDLYLRTDVLLLADVFEGFRSFALKNYGLDPAHYITLPSFAWDALLKFTGVRLELLPVPEMYHYFSAGIRGGISTITHRYAKANNPYIPEYNPKESTSYIMYLDINNLYGWAMKQKLPVGGFEFVGEMDSLPSDEYGYILEVDLDYPPELHMMHNDYPMAPEKLEVKGMSPYCEKLAEKLGCQAGSTEKLVPNLRNKRNYLIHHENLKLYLKHGLVLKKIHGGIRFREEAWMAPYIDFNTNMRKLATTKFQKDLFKLLNNAVFGKSMENVFNYVNIKLVTDPEKFKKMIANPLYRQSELFNHDLAAVMMGRESVSLNKPIYTGFSVLELSKCLMYDFHYSYMLPKYGGNVRLLFTDTDSFCYHITTSDVYQDMKQDLALWFDTSDYPEDHYLHSDQNKKTIGKMKDETSGVPIQEFVGLRSKMYSIKLQDTEKKTAKGISKAVVRKEITHEDYKNTLFNGSLMHHQMTQFRNKKHDIFTVNMDKISLSAYDDKRYVCDDGVHTLAYGSAMIV